ncbi:magnesium and cobalt transport protein CorA [Zavarzinia compransoris]|uniref:Magnesium transporter n=1 Tax=Zavarzinia compransoris TaxID=1264899 RepID=A0A317E9N7_9PROT|nr:magnesium and cobalt transport protein CorA [Zavarzinia compransoris]PWR23004.1 magnesium transporter [Zavarzinia compransoris]TDP46455.1 magnesium transporter [Zavarzinia compransoris]
MPVIASYLYRDGRRLEAVPFHAAVMPAEASDFIWIGLHEPTAEELAFLKVGFGLHELSVDDALNPQQTPKVSAYDDQIFVIAQTAKLEGDGITYGRTAIFVGRRYIITVRHGSDRGHGELRQRLETAPQALRHGTDYILHAILDFIVDGYLPIVRTIEDSVLDMERAMLDAFLDRAQIKRIFKLRREVILFQRVLDAMLDLCGKLVHLDLPCLDAEAKPYFRDALQHMHRIEQMVGGLREVITSVFEASNLLEQQRQGTITRQLASWAAILAVPTAIAGIYGMNFENMPELKTTYGYFVVLGVIALFCGGLYISFRRAKWL